MTASDLSFASTPTLPLVTYTMANSTINLALSLSRISSNLMSELLVEHRVTVIMLGGMTTNA